MLKTLTDNQKQFYQAKYAGKRWTYLPRAAADRFGLTITAVGESRLEVPLEICWSYHSEAMTEYADELNQEYTALLHPDIDLVV